MEQRIKHLRRSFCVAAMLACVFLFVLFAWLAWLQARAIAEQTETALDGAVHTLDDLAGAARTEAFDRLAIAARHLGTTLHAYGGEPPLRADMAQMLVDSATYTVGVSAMLLHAEGGRFAPLATSARRADGSRERTFAQDLDETVANELRHGRGWSGIVQRNGEWLAVSYRPLEPPFVTDAVRLETPLPLRELERYLAALTLPSAFVLLHDNGGLVRLRTRGAPAALSLDQLETHLRGQRWVRKDEALGDTELSVLTAYRPLAAAAPLLILYGAGLIGALLGGLLLARYVWLRTAADAIAPLRDIGRLAADVQRGRNTYALAHCARQDEIGVLAGALVQQMLAQHASNAHENGAARDPHRAAVGA